MSARMFRVLAGISLWLALRKPSFALMEALSGVLVRIASLRLALGRNARLMLIVFRLSVVMPRVVFQQARLRIVQMLSALWNAVRARWIAGEAVNARAVSALRV
jgi:hypothetical protein